MASGKGRTAARYARRAEMIPGSIIDNSVSLLQRQTHDIIRFAMGSPAADAIPSDELIAAFRVVAEHDGTTLFDYGPTEGERHLREVLPPFLRRQGMPLEGELLVTAGGMQGLDLACKLLIDPDDTVLVEAPTYTNGVATILSYEGDVLEAEIDDSGLDVDSLPELVARHGGTPKVIYTIPNFQNPRGTTLTLARRTKLIELAERWDAVILEDDPYGLLRFEGEQLPSLATLANGAVEVVGVYTFSKIIAPGVRVGWVQAAPETIARMIDAKQGMDTCTNVPMQRCVAEYIECGSLDTHLVQLRELYARRRDVMRGCLAESFAQEDVRWTDPEGGFYLWLELPSEVDTGSLFEVALAEGVAFIPGSAFSVTGRFGNALRLCFASTEEARIAEGIARLDRALETRAAAPG